MSKLSDRFRAVGIVNTWELLTRFAKGEDMRRLAIAIGYRAGSSRYFEVSKTAVWSPFYDTNPDGHWQDRRAQTFTGKRAESFPKALAWACEFSHTTPEDWVPDPTSTGRGCLVHRTVRERALAWLKEQS